ncbi:MAG: NAD(P)H-hydrate dehydratase [Candidatus Dormiibacterota bacterium]
MTMVVGVDVTVVDRVAAALRRHPQFAQKIYTDGEQRYAAAKPERWASRWAAKEAVKKLYGSMGERIPTYRDIEVVRRRGGAPQVHVRGEPTDIALSLTHDGGLAIAVAVNRVGGRRHPLPDAPEGLVLAPRPDDANKGMFGRVVVVAGSKDFTGAPRLAAMGAARGGAGLVEVCVPESIHAIVAAGCLEVMPTPLPDAGTGVLHPDALPTIRERLKGADALVIGPGLGRGRETVSALIELLVGLPCRTVVDADALNIVAASGFDWKNCEESVVITPHPAEMARLAGTDTKAVQADRLAIAESYANRYGVVVVLKGAETVVAASGEPTHIDRHHIVALATGGTGDVLAGVIGSLLAQGLSARNAAVAGVTVHAQAGLMVQNRRGRAGALASDLLDTLPAAQELLRQALEAANARR